MKLQIVKMGCDFSPDSKEIKFSDLGNHRFRLHFTSKDNKRIYGDVSCWSVPEYDAKGRLSYSEKRGYFAIHPDLECHGYGYYGVNHDIKQPGVFGWSYKEVTSGYPYTKKGLLKYINERSIEQFDDIEILEIGDKVLDDWHEWFESEVF